MATTKHEQVRDREWEGTTGKSCKENGEDEWEWEVSDEESKTHVKHLDIPFGFRA